MTDDTEARSGETVDDETRSAGSGGSNDGGNAGNGGNDGKATDAGEPSDPSLTPQSGVSRRTLIRLLVGLGLGIPIIVEGLTLLGLIEGELLGGGGGDGATSPTGTTTPPGGVGVGGELLAATPQPETVSDGFLTASGSGRSFTLVVSVENTGDAPYEFRLGNLRTYGGREVGGSATTGRIAPGDSGSVVGRWSIPEGDGPKAVRVAGRTYGDATATTGERAWVPLGRYPVRG